jgi:hypothetical protein
MTPMPEIPVYATEVRFYRDVLGIAYETGSRLRKLGVLTPDAVCDDGRPLFRLSPKSIEAAKVRINQYRGNIVRSRFNLPTTSLCAKTIATP